MPIWLRKFTFFEIKEFYNDEAKSIKNASNKGTKNLINSDGKVDAPAFAEASKAYEGKTSYK